MPQPENSVGLAGVFPSTSQDVIGIPEGVWMLSVQEQAGLQQSQYLVVMPVPLIPPGYGIISGLGSALIAATIINI